MATALKIPLKPAHDFLDEFEGIIVFQRIPGTRRDALYERVCKAYEEHSKIEQDEKGNVYVMPPSGGESGMQDLAAAAQLRVWALRKKHGEAFGPTTTFKFPSGALKVPDAAWASNERVYGIRYAQRCGRIPIVPEFVIEIKSRTDNYEDLQVKMREYIEAGVELGWLIHPKLREVKIYTKTDAKTLTNINKLRGTGPVEGFTLDLESIWRGLQDKEKPRSTPARKK